MYNYDPKSLKAEEFINHEEIEETLRYAEENKHNAKLIDSILEKQSSEKDFRTERQRFCSTATFPKERGNIQARRADQEGLLRQQNRNVRSAVSFKLLRERLPLLPLPRKEQAYLP